MIKHSTIVGRHNAPPPVPRWFRPASRRSVLFVQSTCLALFLSLSTGCAEPNTNSPSRVTFAVDMQQAVTDGWFDPATEKVGVRGDASPLSWGKSINATDADLDYVYEAAIELDEFPDDALVFKFKVDGENNPDDGWQAGANRWLDLSIARHYEASFEDAPLPRPSTFSGTIIQHADFVGAGSDLQKRTLYVYLPPGYSTSTDRYPVLYMHDGRNVFDASEVGGEWKMDENAERLISLGTVDPFIIVGVGNTSDRTTEYTPSRPEGGESGGGGDAYGAFLVNEVKPFIDATYRTRPDYLNTALGGSSLGGLISLYIGLRYPEVFGQLLLVSPSVWWDDEFILNSVRALEQPTDQRIWLYMGTGEGAQMLSGARELRDLLMNRGWTDESLEYLEQPGATHSERAWAGRSEDMIRFLYARTDSVGDAEPEN